MGSSQFIIANLVVLNGINLKATRFANPPSVNEVKLLSQSILTNLNIKSNAKNKYYGDICWTPSEARGLNLEVAYIS